MKLYLARHADYESTLEGALSARGKEQIAALASFLQPIKIKVAGIYHSGLLRAEQTAHALAASIHTETPVQFKPGLTPVDDVSLFLNELQADDKEYLIVGHLPFLSKLVSKMIAQEEYKEIVNFQTGTIVCLEQIETERWAINWVLTSSLFFS